MGAREGRPPPWDQHKVSRVPRGLPTGHSRDVYPQEESWPPSQQQIDMVPGLLMWAASTTPAPHTSGCPKGHGNDGGRGEGEGQETHTVKCFRVPELCPGTRRQVVSALPPPEP